jgi:hypothetical protein
VCALRVVVRVIVPVGHVDSEDAGKGTIQPAFGTF